MGGRQAQPVAQPRPAPARSSLGCLARPPRSPRSTAARAARSDASASATAAWVAERSASVRRRAHADLARRQLDELVDRAARVAQRGRADREREEAEDREAVQRAVDARARRTARTRASAGTNSSSATASWLPVPRRPSVCQVSRTCELGSRDARSRSARAGSASSPATMQPANNSSAWVIPLQKAQRPETTRPPSTGAALAARRPHPGGDPLARRRTARARLASGR